MKKALTIQVDDYHSEGSLLLPRHPLPPLPTPSPLVVKEEDLTGVTLREDWLKCDSFKTTNDELSHSSYSYSSSSSSSSSICSTPSQRHHHHHHDTTLAVGPFPPLPTPTTPSPQRSLQRFLSDLNRAMALKAREEKLRNDLAAKSERSQALLEAWRQTCEEEGSLEEELVSLRAALAKLREEHAAACQAHAQEVRQLQLQLEQKASATTDSTPPPAPAPAAPQENAHYHLPDVAEVVRKMTQDYERQLKEALAQHLQELKASLDGERKAMALALAQTSSLDCCCPALSTDKDMKDTMAQKKVPHPYPQQQQQQQQEVVAAAEEEGSDQQLCYIYQQCVCF
eukprot:gene10547-11684_t